MESLSKISQIRRDHQSFPGKKEDAVLVFSGILGEKLATTANFAGNAVRVLAGFCDKPCPSDYYEIFDLGKMQNLIPRLDVKTAILCVPHKQAAYFVEQLEKAGIVQIWNWSGTILDSTERIDILNETLTTDLLQ